MRTKSEEREQRTAAIADSLAKIEDNNLTRMSNLRMEALNVAMRRDRHVQASDMGTVLIDADTVYRWLRSGG